MQVVEIRYNRKKLIFILTLFAAGLIAGTWYLHFSGKFKANNEMKIFTVLIIAMAIYMCYFTVRRLINNEPFLVLSKDAIEVAEKSKLVPYYWKQINGYRLEKDSDNHYLILEMVEGEKKIGLPSLEKTPQEIEILLEEYKKANKKA